MHSYSRLSNRSSKKTISAMKKCVLPDPKQGRKAEDQKQMLLIKSKWFLRKAKKANAFLKKQKKLIMIMSMIMI